MGGATGGTPLTRHTPSRPTPPGHTPRSGLARLLAGPVEPAARGLLGALVTAHGVTVRLSEVEAYSGEGTDAASDAHRGRTRRNAVMFGPSGYAYVYFTYGMHWCLIVVTGPAVKDRDLARGPARLVSALGVDGSAYGTSVLDGTGPILIAPPRAPVDPTLVRAGPRVGVTGAHDVQWRFWLDGDPTVSTYRRHVPR